MQVTNYYTSERRSASNLKDVAESRPLGGVAYHSYRTHCGLCCVCHTIPVHSRTYYGHVFCTTCFYKYIWTPSKPECSGDVHRRSSGTDVNK